MKVTYNWLKDFVDISIKPGELARKLTMAGLEVTALEECRGDWIFEIEITSNRPDWLSVIGIAREVAAITGKKLAGGPVGRLTGSTRTPAHPLTINIESKKDCPLYTATIIRGVKVAPSPDWLKKRLELLGCRPVDNVVDATNYVLFETGQPLHAFDLNKLSGPAIIVRRAKKGEKLVTIDGQEKVLSPQILAIADKDKVVAAAGIMGGVDSEVGQESKDILLEAAVFDPVLIRRGRRQLGLQSESSYRFERGVDPGTLESARMRAVELIRRICGGDEVLVKSCGLPPKKKRPLDFRPVHAQQILGLPQAAPKAAGILSSLGFGIRRKYRGSLLVEIPSWRTDVTLEADLVEEVARILGYDNVANTLPAIKVDAEAVAAKDPVWRIKNTLAALGSTEVITYSLLDRKLLECFGLSCGLVEIENPLSREQEVLRPALAPSLARCLAQNLNQKQDYVNIFEISKVFSMQGSRTPLEELNLGIALCGEKIMFMESGVAKDKMSLLHLKGMLEAILRRMGIGGYEFRMLDASTAAVYIGRRQVGHMRSLDKRALDYLDIKNKEVFIAEFSLEKILAVFGAEKKFKPLRLYPGISRDISFIIRRDIPAEDILEMIRRNGGPLLEEVRIADYYTGRQIPAGSRSLTVSCLYRLNERTLTESEVTPAHEGIRSLLAERFGAQLR